MKMTEKNTKIESTNTFIPGNSVLAKPMFPLYKNELRKASKPQTINEFVIETKQIADFYPSKKNGDHAEANSIIEIKNNDQDYELYRYCKMSCGNQTSGKEIAEKLLCESGIPYEALMLYKENPVIAFITENIEKFGLEKKLIIQISYYANLYNEPIYKIAIIFADEDIYYKLQYDYNKAWGRVPGL